MIETKFKRTEIGLIPEDWNAPYLGSVCNIKGRIGFRGYTVKDIVSQGFGAITLSPSNIVDGHLSLENVTYISWFKYYESPEIMVYNNDILLVKTGSTVGKTSLVEKLEECATINPQFVVLKDITVNPKFLSEIIKNKIIQNQILSDVVGGAIPTLSQEKISKFIIPLPASAAEQQRIASALTSVDNLLSSLDKLIAKKLDIKQGAMQQLLTGKTRLKGFTTPWNYIQLGKIGSTFGGLTGKSKYDFGVGNAKYITFLNVLNNPILKCELFENVIIKEGEKQNKCRRGDLFFNTSSETPEEVGICAMLDTEIDNLYLNSFCFGFRLFSEKVRAEYLAYYFRSIDGRKLMSSLAQGVTRYNMSKSAFNKAEILMPSSPEEQHAIYQALRNMDDEIAALEAKRKKYEAVKQGMMQQLLTGKIRLINDKIKVRDE